MPKKVLNRKEMKRITISLFHKTFKQKSGSLHRYSLDALKFEGITLPECNILGAAKRIRNYTFKNSSQPNGELISICQLSAICDV